METLQNIPPIVALVLSLLGLVWVVLLFLLPFMIESIRGWTRKAHRELEEINSKLDRITQLLGDRADLPLARAERQDPARKERREPTISDVGSFPIGPERRPPTGTSAAPGGARRRS